MTFSFDESDIDRTVANGLVVANNEHRVGAGTAAPTDLSDPAVSKFAHHTKVSFGRTVRDEEDI